MSQYTVGTAYFENAESTVIGTGTLWNTASNVEADDIIVNVSDGIFYTIASVTDDTHLELSAPYAGTTSVGTEPYVIHRDFLEGIPLMQDGDLETVGLYNEAIKLLLNKINALHP